MAVVAVAGFVPAAAVSKAVSSSSADAFKNFKPLALLFGSTELSWPTWPVNTAANRKQSWEQHTP